jgi:hypothetical protein
MLSATRFGSAMKKERSDFVFIYRERLEGQQTLEKVNGL